MKSLVLPAGALVTILLAAPMLLMLRYSFNSYDPLWLMQEAFTAENYVRAAADEYYRGILLRTLWVALACTAISAILAFGPAYWLARMQGGWKSRLTILTMFPLLVGGVVRSAGYIALFGTEGLINASLRWIGLISAPLEMMYTPGVVILGIVGVVLPYMILTLASVIEGIPRDVEEAAANMGASPAKVFWRVLAPLAAPGMAAGSTLVFILCMNAYATPVLLGGPQFQMMAPAVYDQFSRVSNWPFGAALAFILLIVTSAMTLVGSAALGRRGGAR